jgi:hypothetical protein
MVIALLMQVYFIIVLYSIMRNFEEQEAKQIAAVTNANIPSIPSISNIPLQPAVTTNDNPNFVYIPGPSMVTDPYNFPSAPPRYEKV